LVLILEGAFIATWATVGVRMMKWDLRGNVSADHPLAPFLYSGAWVMMLMVGILAGVLHRWAKDEGILAGGLAEWRDWRKRGEGPGGSVPGRAHDCDEHRAADVDAERPQDL